MHLQILFQVPQTPKPKESPKPKVANNNKLPISKAGSSKTTVPLISKDISSSNSPSMMDKTYKGLGNIIRLLPTGTVFVFQFFNPVFTNNGHCNPYNKFLSGMLIALCGFSCCFSCFTDSYVGTDGITHYGIVTPTGLWPAINSGSIDLSSYKMKIDDFVHAFYSMIVFAVLALLDPNTGNCFYPSIKSAVQVLQVVPPAIGAISSIVFLLFPNKRHGIGYPSSSSASASASSDSSKPSSSGTSKPSA